MLDRLRSFIRDGMFEAELVVCRFGTKSLKKPADERTRQNIYKSNGRRKSAEEQVLRCRRNIQSGRRRWLLEAKEREREREREPRRTMIVMRNKSAEFA